MDADRCSGILKAPVGCAARPGLGSLTGGLHVLTLDVADRGDVEQVVTEASACDECVDVIVNNAGCGLLGTIEEATDADVERLSQSTCSRGPTQMSEATADRRLAEVSLDRVIAETHKLVANSARMNAEAAKLRAENRNSTGTGSGLRSRSSLPLRRASLPQPLRLAGLPGSRRWLTR